MKGLSVTILLVVVVIMSPILIFSQTSVKKGEEPISMYMIGDRRPVFPGGDKAMYTWLQENLDTQKWVKQNPGIYWLTKDGLTGKIIIQFLALHDGTITAMGVVKGINPLIDYEVLKTIQKMPRWSPSGKNNSGGEIYKLPIYLVFNTIPQPILTF